jgi:site-specific DNA-methyltransferase (adenine-specific)
MRSVIKWDTSRGGREAWVEWFRIRAAEMLRVCKPGAFGMIWSHQRTTHWTGWALEQAGWEMHGQAYHLYGQGMGRNDDLKPAVEPWWIIRKPLSETSELKNIERWGVGRLHIEACRVPRHRGDVPGWHKSGSKGSKGYLGTSTFRIRDMSAEEITERCGQKDRWPSSLFLGEQGDEWLESERAGASRFFPKIAFYVPKPTRQEREAGCEDLPDRTLSRLNPGGLSNEPRFAPIQVKNNHSAVKPIELCRFLTRLITPPGGRVLDPFAGSGSIGCAAVTEGFNYVGIEESEDYCQIARARIQHWAGGE